MVSGWGSGILARDAQGALGSRTKSTGAIGSRLHAWALQRVPHRPPSSRSLSSQNATEQLRRLTAQMKVRLRDCATPKLPALSTPKRTCVRGWGGRGGEVMVGGWWGTRSDGPRLNGALNVQIDNGALNVQIELRLSGQAHPFAHKPVAAPVCLHNGSRNGPPGSPCPAGSSTCASPTAAHQSRHTTVSAPGPSGHPPTWYPMSSRERSVRRKVNDLLWLTKLRTFSSRK